MIDEQSNQEKAVIRQKVKLLAVPLIEVQYHKEANQYIHYIKGLGKFGTLVSASHFNNAAGSDLDEKIKNYLNQASLEKLLKLEDYFAKDRSVLSNDLIEKIDAIPNEGEWWKAGTRGTFISVAKKLLSKGFTEEEALDILEDMYSAVSQEYGN